MLSRIDYLSALVAANGPQETDFDEFNAWLHAVHRGLAEGEVSVETLGTMRDVLGSALSTDTLQGRAFRKPYGYPGDFEIIDLIYTGHVSREPHAVNWDSFFQVQQAPSAVRNRKHYYIALLDRLTDGVADGRQPHVLDLACGSCRGVREYIAHRADVPIGGGDIYVRRSRPTGFDVRSWALRWRPTSVRRVSSVQRTSLLIGSQIRAGVVSGPV